MTQSKQIAAYILKYLRAELTPAEEIQFKNWLNADPKNAALVEKFKNDKWVIQQMRIYAQGPSKKSGKKMWAKLALIKKVNQQ